jgi:DNA polymerase-3 subunit epsilon
MGLKQLIFGNRKKGFPEFWQSYLQYFESKPHKRTPIEDLTFVIFDTETTGLNPKTDKILSFGAIRLSANKMSVSESLESYVQQTKNNKDAVLIHGILQNGKEDKKSEEEAVIEFVNYIKDAILVGHNVAFDIAIVNEALKRLKVGSLKNKSLDTAKTAIRVDAHSPNDMIKSSDYMLDALCKKYNISMSNRHTAAGDAFITGVLLMKLLVHLKKRGVKMRGELLRR